MEAPRSGERGYDANNFLRFGELLLGRGGLVVLLGFLVLLVVLLAVVPFAHDFSFSQLESKGERTQTAAFRARHIVAG